MLSPQADGAQSVRVTLSWIDDRELVVHELDPHGPPMVFGRQTHVRIGDPTVGREHFELQCLDGERWRVEKFLSRNGLKLRRNGEAHEDEIDGKATLYDGDKLIAGRTVFTLRIYGGPDIPLVAGTTPVSPSVPLREILTSQQSKVVDVLCRESDSRDLGVTVAGRSNKDIADALKIKVDTVRDHLGGAYARLFEAGFDDFASYADPQVKRKALVLLGRNAGYGVVRPPAR